MVLSGSNQQSFVPRGGCRAGLGEAKGAAQSVGRSSRCSFLKEKRLIRRIENGVYADSHDELRRVVYQMIPAEHRPARLLGGVRRSWRPGLSEGTCVP